jgi:hypothetical protein
LLPGRLKPNRLQISKNETTKESKKRTIMATEKQIQANRRNAQRSTGPKTPEGKAAIRLNALRHGMRARSILLPGENPEERDRLCADLEHEWRPQNRTEQLLVEQMAVAQWKLARLEVGERSIYMQDMAAERQLALLDRFSVQRGRLERSFSRAMRELQDLRKTRPIQEDLPAPETAGIPASAETAPQFTYVMANSDPGAAVPPPVSAPLSSPRQPDNGCRPDLVL